MIIERLKLAATKSLTVFSLALMLALCSTAEARAVLDDGYTFFGADTVMSSGVAKGWYPKPLLKVIGDVPKRSAFRLSVGKGGKELYGHRCELAGRSGVEAQACYDRTKIISQTGVLDFDVYFIDGDTGSESLLRKYKIDVQMAKRFKPGPGLYFIARHGEGGAAMITEKLNVLYLQTTVSPKENFGQVFGYTPYLRCSVNGAPINLAKSDTSFRQDNDRTVSAEFSESTKSTGFQKEYLRFQFFNIQLPLTVGEKSGYGLNVLTKPGKWDCSITGDKDRSLFRKFSFVVGAQGLMPHAEQTAGTINLADKTVLVNYEIPKSGSSVDARIAPGAVPGFFYGIRMSTVEGKAMELAIPTVGDRYPVGY
ncbi:MAG: hypothetical protein R2684_11895 [Pyrinomonadaceae bacterium]